MDAPSVILATIPMGRRRVFHHRRSGKPIGEAVVTSVHEAGHVVMAFACGLGVRAAGLEANGDGFTAHGRSLGWLFDLLDRPRRVRLSAKKRRQVEAHVLVSIAGHVAETIVLGGQASQRWSATTDRDDAEDAARLLGRRPRSYVSARRAEVRRMLIARWPEVEAVAKALRRRRRGWIWPELPVRELRAIVRRAA